MKSHHSLTDGQFLYQLRTATLDAALFSHEAHLRLAWLQLKQHNKNTAIAQTCAIIQDYVQVLGAMDKFNRTLTITAVEAVSHFMRKTKTESFDVFMEKNPALLTDFKSLLQTHYSFDIFASNAAKRNYIAPDLVPFD